MPAYMTLTAVVINENPFSNPQAFLNTWLWLTLCHLLAGIVWSLVVAIPALGFGSFFFKIRNWKWLRVLGGILGAFLITLVLGPVYDADASFRFVGVAWFLVEGWFVGWWLTGIIAQRAIEGAFIVGIRLPNALKALAIFAGTGAVIWAMVASLGIPTLLGAAEWSMHPSTLKFSPTEAGRAALIIGWKLSPLCGIVHGFLAFLLMTWNISLRRMPVPIPMPFVGFVDYREVQGQKSSIVVGAILWALFGYWIASTGYPNGGGATGAVVGGFFGLLSGGGMTFAMDIARRNLLFPRL